MKRTFVVVGLLLGVMSCTKKVDVPTYMRVKPHGKVLIPMEMAGPRPRIFPKVKK